jgi:hypothetical protein
VYARSKALLPVQGSYGVLLHTGRTEAHVMHVALETTYTIVRYAVMISVLHVEKLPLSCASPPQMMICSHVIVLPSVEFRLN